jgi:phosphohistidine phosphatase SixA
MFRTPLKTILATTLLLSLAACQQPAAQTSANLAPATRPAPAAPAVQTRTAARKNFVNARAIILLRHADIDVTKKSTMGNAVPLLPRGEERARELAYALKDAGVTRIITTDAVRTRATAAVLAEELHITPETPAQEGPFMQSDRVKLENSNLFQYLAQNAKPTDTIVVVHHHSVLPGILAQFGFPAEPHYADATEFDRMYIILPDAQHGTYRLFRVRYGGDWHQAK